MSMESELFIQAVSRRSGVASSALRYYEERGRKHGFHKQDWYRAEQDLMVS